MPIAIVDENDRDDDNNAIVRDEKVDKFVDNVVDKVDVDEKDGDDVNDTIETVATLLCGIAVVAEIKADVVVSSPIDDVVD